jgi:hypothetical protein
MKAVSLAALSTALALVLVAAPSTGAGKAPPPTWENLVLVKSKSLDLVYLLPGADFRHYHKVMLEPTEVAFRDGWIKDYNSTVRDPSRRLTDDHAQKIVQEVKTGMADVFAKAYRNAGYEVVNAPGPGVLRLHTFIVNLEIGAPDIPTAGRTRTYSDKAGGATFGLEARDSVTGALLGRAVDSRAAQNSTLYLRTSVTNRSDFHYLFTDWAKASVNGLNALKSGVAPTPR